MRRRGCRLIQLRWEAQWMTDILSSGRPGSRRCGPSYQLRAAKGPGGGDRALRAASGQSLPFPGSARRSCGGGRFRPGSTPGLGAAGPSARAPPLQGLCTGASARRATIPRPWCGNNGAAIEHILRELGRRAWGCARWSSAARATGKRVAPRCAGRDRSRPPRSAALRAAARRVVHETKRLIERRSAWVRNGWRRERRGARGDIGRPA
jgi:hypothetical protein